MQRILSDLGSVTAIIGAQWGDEGKGKVTDILGEHYDIIARAAGGANAGHTIVVDGKKHVFHLLPAGCLHAGKPIVLGAGMVIHLPTLLKELDTLISAGIDLVPRLFISASAHVVMEYHKLIDAAMEEARGARGIGTTKRGIGPAYMDKAARVGIRIGDIRNTDLLDRVSDRAAFLKKAFDISIDSTEEVRALRDSFDVVASCVIPSCGEYLSRQIHDGRSVLIEGAQATLLDIDHGTYPYVTSSATTAAGALQGLGLAPRSLHACIGVAKAYCTRVGSGHFPAEDLSDRGERLRKRGGEYGSTTGRPRRCGWFCIPDARYAAAINGLAMINLTKLDVLDEEESLPVCTEVRNDGTPVYETLPGWKSSTSGIRSWDDLPSNAQAYILYLEEKIGVPIRIIGTGQQREDIIVR